MTEDGLIRPGLKVLVRHGAASAAINGHLPLVCLGEVVERADADVWWINVWMGVAEPIPQMYRTDEILGTPSLGLHYVPVVS